MATPTAQQLALAARRQASWNTIRDLLGAADLRVLGGPDSGGWSAETVIVVADGRRLVARFNPQSEGLFPAADLSTQAACMRAARAGGLPVPEVVLCDGTGDTAGEPVLISAFVEGEVPRDFSPHFAQAGPLFEATAAQQRRYSLDLVERVARLHHVHSPAEIPQGQGLNHHLDRLHSLRDWRGGHELLAEAEDGLRASIPPSDCAAGSSGDVLLWGDARPANTVYGPDFGVVAMLDWELAGRGPAEMDVAWLCEMNQFRGAAPGLPGFLTSEQTWEVWSEQTGYQPLARDWHHRFAVFKLASILDLSFRAEVARGQMDADHRLLADNRGLRRLRDVLET